MSYKTKELPKGMVEIEFVVPVEDFKTDLEHAARHLSEHHPVAGFRPGKASYDVIKEKYGEMAIYEEALPDVVRRAYVTAIRDEKIRAYGQPEISVKKLAPGNALEFTAQVPVLPEVKVTDFRKISVKTNEVKIDDCEIEKALDQIQKMQTREVKVDRELGAKDKATVDMDMSKDGVPVEGGQTRNHGIYLDEEYYIPGLKEKIIGQKIGEVREFKLTFPKDHFQKLIAGSEIDFKVTLNEVHELQHPEINDEFAKTLGQDSMEKLRSLIRENMSHEAEEKERQRRELEALDQIVDKSKFGDIPEQVINDEVERMIQELEHSVKERGLKIEDYLASIKKTLADLKLDFVTQALKRIKTSLVIKQIGDDEKVEADDAEVAAEIEKAMNSYIGNAEAQEQVRSEDYEEYIRLRIRNKLVLDLIREATTK